MFEPLKYNKYLDVIYYPFHILTVQSKRQFFPEHLGNENPFSLCLITVHLKYIPHIPRLVKTVQLRQAKVCRYQKPNQESEGLLNISKICPCFSSLRI